MSEPLRRPGVRRLMGLDLPRPATIASELQDELQLHLDLRTEQLMRQHGMGRDEARQLAHDRYGEIDATKKDINRFALRRGRRMKITRWLDGVSQDARFAARSLTRHKGWTLVAVLTLALGIGANTAVFSVVNDLIIDPMRYPDPKRLVLVMRSNLKSGMALTPTRKLLDAWRANAHSFTAFEGVSGDDMTLSGTKSEPRVVRVVRISPTLFGFAGATLAAGRGFRSDESTPSAPPTAIVTERFAREQFGDVPAAVGQKVKLDTTFYSVVGVVRDGLRLPTFNDRADLLVPLLPDVEYFSGPVVGRLKPGVSLAAGEKELRAIADNLAVADGSPKGTPFVITARTPL